MNTSIYHKNSHLPQINQEEVNKFYQEREISKKRFNPLSPVPFRHQNSQPESINHGSFKNLYRRKSLMHKLKEDESMFTSFNNSLEYNKPFCQSLLRKSTHRTVYENTLNEEQISKSNPNEQNKKLLANKSQNHSSLEHHHQSLYDSGSLESLASRLKKRSNSVQLQSTPMAFSVIRQQKGTVPLSTILKKYQEEVSKLNHQNIGNESNFMSFSKVQLPKEGQMKKVDSNKQNYETFNPNAHSAHQNRQSDIISKPKNPLPEVVEKCIDKWRDLQIEQLRAERLYNKRKEVEKKDIDLQKRSEQLQEESFYINNQTKDKQKDEDLKKKQYERILRQKQEYIKQLEKQSSQYKKFVQSIQKMKTTLEDFQTNNSKHPQTQKPKNLYQKNVPANANEPEANLKELWRWIKSLPAKKSHQTKKEYFR